ncbi:hypothetical protein FRC02_005392 [Tulasnella sp. 418]|nr:hypothetical protein FRC02_005392 [Tulasnella sp. 418]
MDINVVLDAQSISFSLSVNPSSTIADLKQLIRDNCTGRPLPSGQRVIYKGRVLLDNEVVGELLKPADIKHTLHVAVHPAAWATPPPSQTSSTTTSPPLTASLPLHSLPTNPHLLQITSSVHLPQQLILHQHTNAIRILSKTPLQPWLGPGEYRSARNLTKAVLVGANIGWPPNRILDDDIYVKFTNDPSSKEPGVTYAWQVVNNLPYLSLVEGESGSPTAIQLRALETLSYTYPLLPVLPTLPPFSNPTMSVLQSIQNVVNRRRPGTSGTSPVGLNPVPLPNQPQQDINQRPLVWQAVIRQRQVAGQPRLPLRLTFTHQVLTILIYLIAHPTRVLIPIILILARAVFMVYLLDCTPDKHLGWFLCVVAWALWEIYKIGLREGERFVRAAALRNEDLNAAAAAHQPAAAQGNAPANPVQPQAGQDGAQPAAAAPNAAPAPAPAPAAGPAPLPNRQPRGRFAALFDILAIYHLSWEHRQLGINDNTANTTTTTNPDQQPQVGPASVPPQDLVDPTWAERMKVFIAMFIYSMFPAVWARRLSLLRIREGRIREVYGREWRGDEPPEEPEPVQEPAPQPAEGENGDAQQQREEQTPAANAPRNLEAEAKEKHARQRLLTGWRRDYIRRALGGEGDDIMGMIDD